MRDWPKATLLWWRTKGGVQRGSLADRKHTIYIPYIVYRESVRPNANDCSQAALGATLMVAPKVGTKMSSLKFRPFSPLLQR